MIHIKTFVFNPFSENTYIVYDDTLAGVVIDPGCYEMEEKNELDDFIKNKKLNIKYLLDTHAHIDHVLGNYHVKEKYKVPFLMHKKDESVLKAVKAYAPNYGFVNYTEALPDKFLEEGDEVTFGDSKLSVLFLPGHAPGHIGFYNEKEKILIGGDVLFQGSIGRTDLPGGNHETLISSIHQKLFVLPDDVVVYPGHGSPTTLGEEKVSNPFCALSLR
ncbi:MAG: MBL fold metallo-hydrolase [Bacteroidia bacterium]|nr:MBL fold metallo-hydrolase [Bacteroidia bacterium]